MVYICIHLFIMKYIIREDPSCIIPSLLLIYVVADAAQLLSVICIICYFVPLRMLL